ncbi:MAG: hypothetical protein ACK48N_09835 [Planctomyces sp.]|jgi:hypothetical protein
MLMFFAVILIVATFVGGGAAVVALAAAIIGLSKDMKSRQSQPHDVCRHCGYHVGTLDRCPECGLKSPTRT